MLREALRRLRIVGWKIDRRPRRRESANGLQRRGGGRFIRADTVDLAGEHVVLGVGRVAREEHRRVTILDNDRQMIRRVARRRHRDDVAARREAAAARKRPIGLIRKVERLRIEPVWPALRQIAPDAAGDSRRTLDFAASKTCCAVTGSKRTN